MDSRHTGVEPFFCAREVTHKCNKRSGGTIYLIGNLTKLNKLLCINGIGKLALHHKTAYL